MVKNAISARSPRPRPRRDTLALEMRHLVIVDAYNAMYRLLPALPEDRDEGRHQLVERTREALRQGALGGVDRVHLVFDTWAGAARTGMRGRQGRVSWHYAEGSADHAILEHMRRHEGARGGVRITVVTNDRELRGRAVQLGARGLDVDAFYAATRRRSAGLPPLRPIDTGPALKPSDFGLPEGEIDLDDPDYM
jgi:hypothetical protein